MAKMKTDWHVGQRELKLLLCSSWGPDCAEGGGGSMVTDWCLDG